MLIGMEILSHTDLVSRPVHKSQTSWYHADVRGSTMMLSGQNAQVQAAYSYDAYGSVYGERPVVGVPRPVVPEVARPAVERGTEYLYTGKRLEAETGQYDYGFRDYAARVARFTTVDPIRDGWNWYAYVAGDPVNRRDLWGLSPANDGETLSLIEQAIAENLAFYQAGSACDVFCTEVMDSANLTPEDWPDPDDYRVGPNEDDAPYYIDFYSEQTSDAPSSGGIAVMMEGVIADEHMVVIDVDQDSQISGAHFGGGEVAEFGPFTQQEFEDAFIYDEFYYLPLE